ncbi:hypothetical protein DFJ74DRAFT_144606 [Hyaloraphidium curvatum]|nr:hypothetical protein DFJ74DRAFT_144606 [Hyaloraphidium curvatum]
MHFWGPSLSHGPRVGADMGNQWPWPFSELQMQMRGRRPRQAAHPEKGRSRTCRCPREAPNELSGLARRRPRAQMGGHWGAVSEGACTRWRSLVDSTTATRPGPQPGRDPESGKNGAAAFDAALCRSAAARTSAVGVIPSSGRPRRPAQAHSPPRLPRAGTPRDGTLSRQKTQIACSWKFIAPASMGISRISARRETLQRPTSHWLAAGEPVPNVARWHSSISSGLLLATQSRDRRWRGFGGSGRLGLRAVPLGSLQTRPLCCCGRNSFLNHGLFAPCSSMFACCSALDKRFSGLRERQVFR